MKNFQMDTYGRAYLIFSIIPDDRYLRIIKKLRKQDFIVLVWSGLHTIPPDEIEQNNQNSITEPRQELCIRFSTKVENTEDYQISSVTQLVESMIIQLSKNSSKDIIGRALMAGMDQCGLDELERAYLNCKDNGSNIWLIRDDLVPFQKKNKTSYGQRAAKRTRASNDKSEQLTEQAKSSEVQIDTRMSIATPEELNQETNKSDSSSPAVSEQAAVSKVPSDELEFMKNVFPI